MHGRLREVLGDEEAATLMEHLPPVGWADVATKRDLDRLKLDLDHQTVLLKTEIATAKAELRGEIATFNAELRGEIALAEARFELALREQTRTFLFGMVASNATLAGLAFAAAAIV
jgi:hypothetical protein